MYELRELEHKPKVVGLSWVVECVEQRSKVDEGRFIVDLDIVHIPNFGSKRRRSMLPQPPKIQLGGVTDLGGSSEQVLDNSESAVESETETSTEGEVTILRRAWLGV